jgi:hypothetical protein
MLDAINLTHRRELNGIRNRIPLCSFPFIHNLSVNDRAFVVLAAFRSAARFGLRSGLAASGALARAGLL